MAILTKLLRQGYDRFIVVFYAFVVLLPSSPLNMPFSYRDSGVFLYVAWRMLCGEVPYRDVWDHKPPIIYLVNAIGLALSPGSRWGVWLIEVTFLFIAVLLAHKLIKETFGSLPAVFALLLFLTSLAIAVQGGNLTTEYALPLQFGCLIIAYTAIRKGVWFWRGYLIGLLGTLTFLIRPTAVAVALAFVIYLIIIRLKSHDQKKLIRELLSLLLGGLTVLIMTVLLFTIMEALPQFVDAVFHYNFVYSGSSPLIAHANSIIDGLAFLSKTWLAQFTFIGVASAIVLVAFKEDILRESNHLIEMCLIALPIELLLVAIPGRSYPHYYIALLPVFSVFSALALWILLIGVSQLRSSPKARSLLTVTILAALVFIQLRDYRKLVIRYRHVGNPDIISFVSRYTSEDDYVLLWGAESSINFFAKRRSPTKYVYQFPLYMQGYVNKQMIEEFLEDILRQRPRLIIDTQNVMMPFFKFPYSSPAIEGLTDHVLSHYRMRTTIRSWNIYEYVEDVPELQ